MEDPALSTAVGGMGIIGGADGAFKPPWFGRIRAPCPTKDPILEFFLPVVTSKAPPTPDPCLCRFMPIMLLTEIAEAAVL
jgi:hypothetical protein